MDAERLIKNIDRARQKIEEYGIVVGELGRFLGEGAGTFFEFVVGIDRRVHWLVLCTFGTDKGTE